MLVIDDDDNSELFDFDPFDKKVDKKTINKKIKLKKVKKFKKKPQEEDQHCSHDEEINAK